MLIFGFPEVCLPSNITFRSSLIKAMRQCFRPQLIVEQVELKMRKKPDIPIGPPFLAAAYR